MQQTLSLCMTEMNSTKTDPASKRLPILADEVNERYEAPAYVCRDAWGEKPISLPDTLVKLGLVGERTDLERLLAEQGGLEQLAEYPIIGVLGMLNSGKSALVRSFLSEAGAERIPVGIGRIDGTQRFVLWLPEAWREGTILRQMEQLIEKNFGAAPELLSEQGEEAKHQYNDGSRFTVPLIAFDRGLDERQVAFLDCPDIEREMAGEGNAAEPGEAAMVSKARQALLNRAAELCSAFVLVAELREMEKKVFREFFGTVEKVIPGLPLFAALNKAPGERSAEDWCAAFADRVAELKLERVYLAYDFHDRRSADHLPDDARQEWDLLEAAQRDPLVFFTESAEPGVPRLLSEMPTTQGPGKWVRQRVLSGWDAFAKRSKKAEEAIEEQNDAVKDRREAAVAAVQEAVEMTLIEEGEIRMPISLSAGLLEKAIRRTAPFATRGFFGLRKGLEKAGNNALSGIRFVYRAMKGRLLGSTREDMEEAIKDKLREQDGVPVDVLIEALRARANNLGVSEEELETGARHAFERWLKRFETFADTVNGDQLDAFLEEEWKRMSYFEMAKVSLIVGVVSGLTCVAFFAASIDGGLSTAVVASGAGSVLGGIMTLFSTKQFYRYLRSTLGQRTFSELTAYLLDAYGLPRSALEGVQVSDEKIAIDFSGTDAVEAPVADLHLGRSIERLEGVVGLSAWIQAKLDAGKEGSR